MRVMGDRISRRGTRPQGFYRDSQYATEMGVPEELKSPTEGPTLGKRQGRRDAAGMNRVQNHPSEWGVEGQRKEMPSGCQHDDESSGPCPRQGGAKAVWLALARPAPKAPWATSREGTRVGEAGVAQEVASSEVAPLGAFSGGSRTTPGEPHHSGWPAPPRGKWEQWGMWT